MALIFANRSALKAGLISWMADGNLDSDTLDRSIALAESEMRRRLRVFDMEVTQDLTITSETLVVPSRFLSVKRAYIPGYQALDYLTPEALIEKLSLHRINGSSSSPGRPEAFTLEGREDLLPLMRFAPVPDTSYTLRLTFVADPGLLDDEDCNSILDDWPDAYLYGCLSHLGDHARNKERLPDWQKKFGAILQSINAADLRDRIAGSTLVPRVPHRVA